MFLNYLAVVLVQKVTIALLAQHLRGSIDVMVEAPMKNTIAPQEQAFQRQSILEVIGKTRLQMLFI